jgi:hypothetical protein
MNNKVYDQREDLHELKKFKNDMTSNSDLLSCPFCGRAARFDVVPCEDGIANAGGEYVICTNCRVSTALCFSLGEDVKPKLAVMWNVRTG